VLEHEEIGWCVLSVPFLWLNQIHKKRRKLARMIHEGLL
jgi:hypothetical protein